MQKPQVRIDHGAEFGEVKIVALAPDISAAESRGHYGYSIVDTGEFELDVRIVGNQGGELWVGAMLAAIDGHVKTEVKKWRLSDADEGRLPQLVAVVINTLMGEGFAVPVDPAAARADEGRSLRARAADLRAQAERLEQTADALVT